MKAYWRQQVGYGEGETWLDAHHPEKFLDGHMLWRGRIYSPLPFVRALTGRRVNTGVWGTAAFPSVYRTDVPSAAFLPHSPGWMLGATGLILAGVLALLIHPGEAAALVLAAGLTGWAVTVGRCAAFAAGSDLSGLPAIGAYSLVRSRWHYRALIAWLHLLQPVARMYGRMRGLLSPADVAASPHVATVPWTAPPPSLRSAVASARLQLGGTAEWSFWSESWTAQSTFLTALIASLRAARPSPRVDIDDGWRTDRDLSIAVGRWAWLHVRALIEEHAEGRVLCRVAARVQPSVNGILRAVLLSAALIAASSAAIALRWPWATMAVMAAAVALFVIAAWQTTRSVAVLDRALARVTSHAGMLPLPGRDGGLRLTWRPSTVVHKGQAALMLSVVSASVIVSGFLMSRDLATRTGAGTGPRPAGLRLMAPVLPARRPSPASTGAVTTVRRNAATATGAVAPAGPRRNDPRSQLGGRAAQPPPAPRRVPRRTA